jgi:hypothetical protein
MPYTEVMHKWKAGTLHSGSKSGPKVTSQKQAVAIMLDEKRKSAHKPEYRAADHRNDNWGNVSRELSPRAQHHLSGRRPIADERHESRSAERAESASLERRERRAGVENK